MKPLVKKHAVSHSRAHFFLLFFLFGGGGTSSLEIHEVESGVICPRLQKAGRSLHREVFFVFLRFAAGILIELFLFPAIKARRIVDVCVFLSRFFSLAQLGK